MLDPRDPMYKSRLFVQAMVAMGFILLIWAAVVLVMGWGGVGTGGTVQ